jgi:hypothetical protein
MSEVLTLGVPDEDGEVVLLRPDLDVPVGRTALLSVSKLMSRKFHEPFKDINEVQFVSNADLTCVQNNCVLYVYPPLGIGTFSRNNILFIAV